MSLAGKILIVDDVATNRIVLKVKLAAAFYETIQATDGAGAIQLARDLRPAMVLLDVELPDMSGIEVCRILKSDPVTRDIPVVMITAFRDATRKMEALEAGAEEVFWKPLDELVLLARLRSLIRARETAEQLGLRDGTYRELGFAESASEYDGQALVGLVTGRVETALCWKREIQPYLGDRMLVLDRDAVLGKIDKHAVPDVFVLAADIDGRGDGLRLMSELRSRPETRHSAICVVLPENAGDTPAMALDLGASDLIEANADPAEMALRIRTQIARKRQSDRLRASLENGLRLAMVDPLTGLYNRRYALPHLARMGERVRDTGRQCAVMVLDLDRFKLINDTHGHASGDAVLIDIASRLTSNLRAVDLIARIGGEEFLVALPDTTPEAAHATAERLRRVVSDNPVVLPKGRGTIEVTLSIGLTVASAATLASRRVEDLIGLADQALLDSKSEGRNQVTVAQSAA
ncbi:MAG: diguanylate cyclase [Paracoccaceae bacterium]|jgi:two-component system cell cycle response regulator|nr:diguanylate cyclase [Paracoccaceae bacterium]